MKNKIIAGSAAVLIFGFSSVSLAAGPTRNYISLSWIVSGELVDGSFAEDLEGFQFTASKGLGDMFFVRVAANNIGVDLGGVVADVSTQQFGGGVRFGVATGLDLWAALNYDRVDLDGLVGTGFGLEAGARWLVMKDLELGLTYKNSPSIDFDVADGEYSGYELSAVYNVSPKVGILLTFSNHNLDVDSGGPDFDYENVVGLGVRLEY